MAKLAGKNGAGVYGIFNLINGKVYIGSSVNVEKRLKQHKNHLTKGNHCNPFLSNAWNKYSQNNFCFSIIEKTETRNVRGLEQYYIDILKTHSREFGYNLNPNATGGNHIGNKASLESKKKMSLWQIGKKLSEETKRKIGLKSLGRNKGNKFNLGKKASDLTKQKLSEIQKIIQNRPEKKIQNIQRGLQNRELNAKKQAMFSLIQIDRVRWYYDDGMTQTGLAKMFNCSRTTIHNVLNCKKFAYREAS